MSIPNNEGPILAPEGPSDLGAGQWAYAPTRKSKSFAKWRNPIGITGAIIVGFNVFIAIFGPYIWTIDPDELVATRLQDPSWAHPMGTDELGRDTMARIIHGAQVSLQVGAISVGIAFVLGVSLGLLSGFFGGKVDSLLMRFVDMMFALPGLVLAIVIAGLLGPNRRNAMIAIGIVITPAFARVVRGSVLEVMGFPFVESARALGASHKRIMVRNVLPNIAAPLIVQASLGLGTAIITEASLSFLGVGVQAPTPSWGLELRSGYQYMELNPAVAIFPGLLIFMTVLSFNFLGDALRTALDPRLARRG